MTDAILIIIEISLPIILSYIVWELKENRKERKANTQGMKEILGYMIDRWYEEFKLRGSITTDQRNTFESAYKAYAANHGNGAREAKWHDVEKMPIDDTKAGISPFLEFYLEQHKTPHE